MQKIIYFIALIPILFGCQNFNDWTNQPTNRNIHVVDATAKPKVIKANTNSTNQTTIQSSNNIVNNTNINTNNAVSNQNSYKDLSTVDNTPTYGVVKPYVPEGLTTSQNGVGTLNSVNVVDAQATVPNDHYTVVKGDTLYSIAFRYGLDYKNLAQSNNIDPPYNVKVGQVLILNIQKSQAPVYIVKKGDTLYSIAHDNGQSVTFLASVNNLTAPYNLYTGQKLLLARHSTAQKATTDENVIVAGNQEVSQTNVANTKSENTSVNTNSIAQTKVYAGKSRKVGGIIWSWPASGKLVEGFSLKEQGNKGIDICADRGSRVLSAADGQVVYAGNALRGYGNLIIINHANEYLSAYAHNDELLVKEGQKIKRGQQIAKMGSTDAPNVRLHFEIRYRGQSVNPINYLPR